MWFLWDFIQTGMPWAPDYVCQFWEQRTSFCAPLEQRNRCSSFVIRGIATFEIWLLVSQSEFLFVTTVAVTQHSEQMVNKWTLFFVVAGASQVENTLPLHLFLIQQNRANLIHGGFCFTHIENRCQRPQPTSDLLLWKTGLLGLGRPPCQPFWREQYKDAKTPVTQHFDVKCFDIEFRTHLCFRTWGISRGVFWMGSAEAEGFGCAARATSLHTRPKKGRIVLWALKPKRTTMLCEEKEGQFLQSTSMLCEGIFYRLRIPVGLKGFSKQMFGVYINTEQIETKQETCSLTFAILHFSARVFKNVAIFCCLCLSKDQQLICKISLDFPRRTENEEISLQTGWKLENYDWTKWRVFWASLVELWFCVRCTDEKNGSFFFWFHAQWNSANLVWPNRMGSNLFCTPVANTTEKLESKVKIWADCKYWPGHNLCSNTEIKSARLVP